jgi:hypothetical protein
MLPDVINNAKSLLSKHPIKYSSELTLLGTPAAKKSTDTRNKQWVEKALQLANSHALLRYKAGVREITARNICESVATELAKDLTTHGTRGPRTGGSIRNEALRGWKFLPPTGTNGTSGTK